MFINKFVMLNTVKLHYAVWYKRPKWCEL